MKNYLKQNEETVQNVNFKIDSVVKSSAEATLSSMGLNMSAYIGMCLRQLAQDRKIPFTQTIDPDFWTIEAQVSEAKSYIDSGMFSTIIELKTSLADKWAVLYKEMLSSFTFGSANSDSGLVAAFFLLKDWSFDKRSLSSLHESLDEFSLICDKVCGLAKGWHDLVLMKNFSKEMADYLNQKVDELFNENEYLKQCLNTDVENINDADKRKILDDIYYTVINVAKRYKTDFSMRFIGASKQNILQTVFSAAERDEELKNKLKVNQKQQSEQDSFQQLKDSYDQYLNQIQQTYCQQQQDWLAQLRKEPDELTKTLAQLRKTSKRKTK